MRMPNFPPWLEATVRAVQFIAALVSLVLWAIYLSHLVGGATSSLHAVLGIVVSGTTWAIMASVSTAWKHRKSNKAKATWGKAAGLIVLIAVIDFCFICLFAAVAGITGPSARGQGAACRRGDDEDNDNNNQAAQSQVNGSACGQNQAVFALAIVNVFSFSASSIFNAIQSSQGPPNPKNLAKGPASMEVMKDAFSST